MRRASWVFLLAAVLGASFDSPARAQLPVGVPTAQGVPGDLNPPNWLAAAPDYAKTVNDPRWHAQYFRRHQCCRWIV